MSDDQGKVDETADDDESLYQWESITYHKPDAIIRGLIASMELDAGVPGAPAGDAQMASVVEMASYAIELAKHFESVLLGYEFIQIRDDGLAFLDVPRHLQLQRAKIIGFITRKTADDGKADATAYEVGLECDRDFFRNT